MCEVFGMRLDSIIFYNEMVNIFAACMDRTFGADIKKIETICSFEHMGSFILKYNYLPNNYKIEIENELRAFEITIYDSEQAYNSLYRISKFNNQLDRECIEDSILLLKNVLEKNDFNMYFRKNGKLYRKNAEGIKRIKDIKRERMFDEFDKYIFEFAVKDFAVDYWYDEGVDIAENMLCKFEENDWKVLLEVVSERTVEWQKHLAYCMHDKSDLNQLKVLLKLVETDDSELFEIVVDSLRGFTSEESLNLIQTDSRIVSKIEELMPKVGDVTKRVFEEFLKNK